MKRSGVWWGIVASVLILAGCMSFEGSIPIELSAPDTSYISPKIQDGIQDQLIVPVVLPQIERLVVQGYNFSVMNAEGEEVFSLSDELPERRRRQALEIPDELIWDGVSLDGEYVDEGEYSWVIEAWDRNGNSGETVARYVVVDNTPPSVEVHTSYPLFSPNNDGRLDSLLVHQINGSNEDQWYGSFVNEQRETIRLYSWAGVPLDFRWDGKDDEGDQVPDGVYQYVLNSTDRAGNTSTVTLENLAVDTEPTDITLDTDLRAFSPNRDGTRDLIAFIPILKNVRNIDTWTIEVLDSFGELHRTFSGNATIPAKIVFDGMNENGVFVDDGSYRGILSVQYKNGDAPIALSPSFAVDTTKPYAVVSVPYKVFSPDGDKRKDDVEIRQSTSSETEWQGALQDSSGRTVRRYTWNGRALTFTWNAKNQTGVQVQDGVYTYVLAATDEAGNAAEYRLPGLTVDVRPTPVTMVSSVSAFSPNGDGVKDIAPFDVSAAVASGVSEWRLEMLSVSGTAVRTIRGSGSIPPRIVWDGALDSGKIVEGRYTARLSVEYDKGNLSSADARLPLVLDISAPQIKLTSRPTPFSPDGDGVDDALLISIEAVDVSPIDEWRADFIDPAGNLFRTFAGTGKPSASITWDGKAANGELVQSAEDYELRFSARDSLWNIATALHTIPVDILVIKEGDKLRIVISSIYFKPFTADYTNIDTAQATRNRQTLDRLAVILEKYDTYQISIEGHAVRIYWNDPKRLEVEEREVLQGLSEDRAKVIKNALVTRGVRETRMTTIGFGGTNPVVPHSDLENRWKNRRVEFILVRGN